MTGLFAPGAARAGTLFTDAALLAELVAVEAAWLAELVEAKLADDDAADDLAGLVDDTDTEELGTESESAGNAVVPLVALLRARLGERNPAAARWLHRGLTSQDVLDTALVRCARDANRRLRAELSAALAAGAELARQHRDTAMVARTLTQPALPYTFGTKVATWLHGLADATDDLDRADAGLPAQFGGAAGTLAALTELFAGRGAADPAAAAREFTARVARRLELPAAPPWHTARAPVTRLGAAWVGVTAAAGRIADDVLVLSRPELGELSEPAGRGGSSSLPQKANPVLSVLIRRTALTAPSLGAQLQLAAATTVDERPDGAWHAEWPALQSLGRSTVVAAAQLAELLIGLQVHAERMRANLGHADVSAEQRAMAELVTASPAPAYLGVTEALIDAAVERARVLVAR